MIAGIKWRFPRSRFGVCVYINSGKLFIPALHHQGHIAPLGQHSFSPGRKEGSKEGRTEGGAAGCCVNISFDWRRRSTAGHVTPTAPRAGGEGGGGGACACPHQRPHSIATLFYLPQKSWHIFFSFFLFLFSFFLFFTLLFSLFILLRSHRECCLFLTDL